MILADMGAAQGHRMIPWFRDFYKVMQESGLDLRWTAVGVIDTDIASARSVIDWGEELQNTVDYVIVHNHFQEGVASSWENPKLEPDVTAFRRGVFASGNSNGRKAAGPPADDADDERHPGRRW